MLDEYISQQQTLTAFQNYVYLTIKQVLLRSWNFLSKSSLIFFTFNCVLLFESLAYNKIILRKKIMKIKKNEYGAYCDMNDRGTGISSKQLKLQYIAIQ